MKINWIFRQIDIRSGHSRIVAKLCGHFIPCWGVLAEVCDDGTFSIGIIIIGFDDSRPFQNFQNFQKTNQNFKKILKNLRKFYKISKKFYKISKFSKNVDQKRLIPSQKVPHFLPIFCGPTQW